MTTPDYDGDGDTTESIKDELKGLQETLYPLMQNYAANNIAPPNNYIIYASNYPYYFIDTDMDGQVDPGENIFPRMYSKFDSTLLRAAYNYQFSKKDPHGFIHNSLYIAQLLVDSIVDLGGNPALYPWR